jgi:23S rRNA A1618 N6-methylase RlmF
MCGRVNEYDYPFMGWRNYVWRFVGIYEAHIYEIGK